MEKTDKEVVATLLKANRRDLARAYVREVTTAKKNPTKTMQVALNNARMTLDGLANRNPAYRPLVKKFKSLSDEIFKTLKEQE